MQTYISDIQELAGLSNVEIVEVIFEALEWILTGNIYQLVVGVDTTIWMSGHGIQRLRNTVSTSSMVGVFPQLLNVVDYIKIFLVKPPSMQPRPLHQGYLKHVSNDSDWLAGFGDERLIEHATQNHKQFQDSRQHAGADAHNDSNTKPPYINVKSMITTSSNLFTLSTDTADIGCDHRKTLELCILHDDPLSRNTSVSVDNNLPNSVSPEDSLRVESVVADIAAMQENTPLVEATLAVSQNDLIAASASPARSKTTYLPLSENHSDPAILDSAIWLSMKDWIAELSSLTADLSLKDSIQPPSDTVTQTSDELEYILTGLTLEDIFDLSNDTAKPALSDLHAENDEQEINELAAILESLARE